MHCPSCNAENEPNAETCFTCGKGFGLSRGSVVAQRYEIQRLLGRGGMGMIYKAHDHVLDETVVLKTMRSQLAGDAHMVRRFRAEIKMARRIRHKNICAIHDYGEEGNLVYISMEFIDGIDLKQILREDGRLPADEGFDVAIQVARGLEAIHEAGVIHRDLKGHNIMRDTRGVIKLLDFGIAKQEDAEGGMTGTGQIVGTPEYMSPEQVRGAKVDYRSDLYALGIVIFEVFTGRVPFRGDTPVITIFKHLQEEPPLSGNGAEDIPEALIPTLKRLLAKNPRDRFGSAADVIDALHEARRAAPSGSAPAIPAPEPTLVPRPTPVSGAPTALMPAQPPVPMEAPRSARAFRQYARIGLRMARVAATVIAFAPLRASYQARPIPTPVVFAAVTPQPAPKVAPPVKRQTPPIVKSGGTVLVPVSVSPSANAGPPVSRASNPPGSVVKPPPPSTADSQPAPLSPLPSAEQLRTEHMAGLLERADAAMSADQNEAALQHFEEALTVDPQNAKAIRGRAKAWALLAAARKMLIAGRATSCEAGNPGKGRGDFVGMSTSEFNGRIQFEPSVAKPRPGQPYTIRINLLNQGLKPARIQGVRMTTSVNDVAGATVSSARVKELAPGEKALLDEIGGVWGEGTTSWALDVVVTAKNKDICRNSLSWK